MSHFACSEDRIIRSTRMQIERFREVRALFPGIAGLAREFVRHFPRARRALRSGAAGRRALRRQSDAGQPNPMQPVVDLQGRIVQLRDVEQGETVGYSATWTAQAADAARDRRRSATPTAFCAPRARAMRQAGRRGDRRRPALPARRPRLDGPDRDRRHRCAGRRGRSAAISSTLIGDGHRRRRSRGARRHHRLRGADQRSAGATGIGVAYLCSGSSD